MATKNSRRFDHEGEDERLDQWARSIPERLFKYMALDGERLGWAKRLIVESMLFFPSPSSFNDPFDCRIAPSFDASAMVIDAYWREYLREQGKKARDHRADLKKLILRSKTPRGQEVLTQSIFKTIDRAGTACFAKSTTSILMWSYYAAGHRGITVRFNTSPEQIASVQRTFLPIEVTYANEFPRINFYKRKETEFVRSVLGTKAKAWQHEEEWRFVLVNEIGYLRMPMGMIDGVVLGLRTSPEDEQSIREFIAESGRRIELLRVVHKPNSFILELQPP